MEISKKYIKPFTLPIDAEVRIPGSKSISNRAFVCASLCEGGLELGNLLESEDTMVMREALSQFGVDIKGDIVIGNGGDFQEGDFEIYLANAGTATRFLTALAGLRRGKTLIKGKERMYARPIEILLKALRDLGVDAQSVNGNGCPPVLINGTGQIRGGKTMMRGDVSSQYFSALLQVAPLAENPVEIEIDGKLTSLPYVEMTIAMLRDFGIHIDFDGKRFRVEPQQYKNPKCYQIESDASTASHILSIAAGFGGRCKVYPFQEKSLQGDSNFVEILAKMGARYNYDENGLIIESDGNLKPLGEVDLSEMPDAGMNAVVLSALAYGESYLKGLSTLRDKETDRIKALSGELEKLGVEVEEGADYIRVFGRGMAVMKPAEIKTYDDHRMAMSFSVIGALMEGVVIDDPMCSVKTFPKFWEAFESMRNYKNIALSGMRCVGKTVYGKKLAERLAWDFIDIDAEIEKEAQESISEIVKNYGWDYFRDLEHAACQKFAQKEHIIISLGGGAIIFDRNKKLFRDSLVAFLYQDLDILAKRLEEASDRPALNGKSHLDELDFIWHDRKGKYLKNSDIVVDLSQKDGVDQIIEVLHLERFLRS
ncbi:MAG: 3-phosphoshikimate 1-carboxyvinyltransferase [Candidatus Gracilibacteria bacterium]|nr:3-phosphoshikimate 1-carboxyvinyltransferase [Candidatus Gracilibacteria bacterium]